MLSLIDLANNNDIITAKSFDIDVLNEETPPTVDDTTNNASNNTVVEELPKTGTSIGEYLLYFFVIGAIFLSFTIYFNRRRFNN